MGFDEEWRQLREGAAEAAGPTAAAEAPERNRVAEFAGRLAEFRERPVLVPFDERGGLWTSRLGGLDWICAFSDEETLAGFARARGETDRAWEYHRVLGARLLDEVIPALDFGCGVAWDAAGPDGVLFPPVRGVVPDSAALDAGTAA
ncbi:SseB family protein [Streptomyces racemochromogenes]|uniref:SseB family protein n=1 Tax=Streptomyces racemochromogenes TaxID=67353 RepID=A0ABW7PNR7_9ACTN